MSWQTAVAIAGVAISPVLGFVGVIYGTRSQAKRDRDARELEQEQERKRWEREDALERERAEREQDRQRESWRREDRDRWAERRLEAHAAVLRTTRATLEWAQGHIYGEKIEPSPIAEELKSQLQGLLGEATAALAELELVSSGAVRQAAQSAVQRTGTAAGDVWFYRWETENFPRARAGSSVKAGEVARERYLDLAQHEIGLVSTRIAPDTSGTEPPPLAGRQPPSEMI